MDHNEYELIKWFATRIPKLSDGEIDLDKDWETKEGYCGPQGVAPLVLVHYPVDKGWEVSFYMEDEEND